MQLNHHTGRVVIVGAGQAGAELAGALRQKGFQGQLTMIGDEPYLPYRRPALSKTFLAGEATLESLYLKNSAGYDKLAVDVRVGVRVEEMDRTRRQVRLSDGSVLPYDKLALTTGGRARRLPLPGADAPNVHYVRTIDDVLRLRAQFLPGRRLAIIGGGYIGLEAASVGVKQGLAVTVIETMPRVLARVAVPQISAYYEAVHHAHGVDLRTGVGVLALDAGDKVTAVVLANGERIEADLVIVGIGLIPNTELAEAAGLNVSNGIVVDAQARTSDPDIVACGDCTLHVNRFYPQPMRLESVPNAIEQARVASATLLGKDAAYDTVPWFWSDQYDLKLQMVGLSEGHDNLVVRGDMVRHAFVAFYLRDGVVIAADAVNRASDFMVAKRLVAERVRTTARALADEAQPLKALLAASTADN